LGPPRSREKKELAEGAVALINNSKSPLVDEKWGLGDAKAGGARLISPPGRAAGFGPK